MDRDDIDRDDHVDLHEWPEVATWITASEFYRAALVWDRLAARDRQRLTHKESVERHHHRRVKKT